MLIAIMITKLLEFTPWAAKMQIEDKVYEAKCACHWQLKDLMQALKKVERVYPSG